MCAAMVVALAALTNVNLLTTILIAAARSHGATTDDEGTKIA